MGSNREKLQYCYRNTGTYPISPFKYSYERYEKVIVSYHTKGNQISPRNGGKALLTRNWYESPLPTLLESVFNLNWIYI